MKMQQSGGLLLAATLGGNTEIESNPSISAKLERRKGCNFLCQFCV